jgi:hypothetical protein
MENTTTPVSMLQLLALAKEPVYTTTAYVQPEKVDVKSLKDSLNFLDNLWLSAKTNLQ